MLPLRLARAAPSFRRFLGSSLVRRRAPGFTAQALVDGKIATVSTADLAGKYWALLFYPLDLYGPS
jgi:hypothetical protein